MAVNRGAIRSATKEWNKNRPEAYGDVRRQYDQFGLTIEAPIPDDDLPDPAIEGLVNAIANQLDLDAPQYEILEE